MHDWLPYFFGLTFYVGVLSCVGLIFVGCDGLYICLNVWCVEQTWNIVGLAGLIVMIYDCGAFVLLFVVAACRALSVTLLFDLPGIVYISGLDIECFVLGFVSLIVLILIVG